MDLPLSYQEILLQFVMFKCVKKISIRTRSCQTAYVCLCARQRLIFRPPVPLILSKEMEHVAENLH